MSAAIPSKRWLYGPWPDLLLGCGLGYVALLFWLALSGAAASLHPAVPALLAVLISGPHYGATLLRVYERRSERQSYALFSTWATLIVVGAVVVGVFQHTVALVLFTLYITWSPWHYSGQNYGIAVMFLRRQGVELEPRTKRLLYLSFVSSFAVTFLTLHGSGGALEYNPNAVPYESTQLAVLPLGIPRALTEVLMVAALAGYLASLAGAALALRRRAEWRELLPTGALVLSQALWFVVPFSVAFYGWRTGVAPFDRMDHFVLWTALAHAAQYLWITSYYARNDATWNGQPRYLLKALAAGAAVWTLPVIAFAPDLTGGPEYLAGMGLLIAAGVNLHHFILDGAIWKLRNTRIANILIRPAREPAAADALAPAASLGWLGRGVWALCGAAIAVALLSIWWESSAFRARLRQGDPAGAEAVLENLARVGRDSSAARVELAAAWSRSGALQRARGQLERSLELRPGEQAFVGLAGLAAQERNWDGVLEVHERASAVSSTSSAQLDRLVALARYGRGEAEQGRELVRELAAREPRSARQQAELGALAREGGDWPTSIQLYREALALQPDRRSAANNLAWMLATADDRSLRDPEEAIHWAQHALEGQEPPDPNLLDTLATAYAAAGQRAQAIATATRAAELARERGLEPLAAQLESRLAALRD